MRFIARYVDALSVDGGKADAIEFGVRRTGFEELAGVVFWAGLGIEWIARCATDRAAGMGITEVGLLASDG